MISEILMSCPSKTGEEGTVVEQLAETGGRLSKGKILAHPGMMLGFRSGPDERRAGAWCAGGSST